MSVEGWGVCVGLGPWGASLSCRGTLVCSFPAMTYDDMIITDVKYDVRQCVTAHINEWIWRCCLTAKQQRSQTPMNTRSAENR